MRREFYLSSSNGSHSRLVFLMDLISINGFSVNAVAPEVSSSFMLFYLFWGMVIQRVKIRNDGFHYLLFRHLLFRKMYVKQGFDHLQKPFILNLLNPVNNFCLTLRN